MWGTDLTTVFTGEGQAAVFILKFLLCVPTSH
jgi:hypothetical protein